MSGGLLNPEFGAPGVNVREMRLGVAGASAKRGCLPIVVGVTGHRDLRVGDVPALESAVADAFGTLLAAYRHTPLLLVSALAAGADQLAARVARANGIPIVAPMPLERAEYERDFNVEERDEFSALLRTARCAFFVGYAPGNDARSVANDERARAIQYARLGAYVACNSQILLALWNGRETDHVGGTAQVVAYRRRGVALGFDPPPRPLDRPEFGPVWHIVTPRASDATAPAAPFTRTILWPLPAPATGAPPASGDPSNAAVTELILRRIDRFNEDALRGEAPERAIEAPAIVATAEELARRYRTATVRTLSALYATAFAAASLFVFYAHHPSHATALIELDLALTVVALAVFAFARRRELQNLYQDYRAVAEGLRVQSAWQAANVRETVADHYLRQYRGELDWIRNVIRVCRLIDEAAVVRDSVSPEDGRDAVRGVAAGWIAGQLTYFEERIRTDERTERRLSTITWIAAATGIAATSVLVVCYGVLGHRPEDSWWTAGVVVAALAAVASGLLASYADQRAYMVHVKRYRRIRAMFAQANAALHAILAREPFTASDHADARDVIRELGREALLENAGWVMLHRERPLEFVQGG